MTFVTRSILAQDQSSFFEAGVIVRMGFSYNQAQGDREGFPSEGASLLSESSQKSFELISHSDGVIHNYSQSYHTSQSLYFSMHKSWLVIPKTQGETCYQDPGE
jgi:hypothetical protein